MTKIIKFLKPYAAWVALVFLLVAGQSLLDLYLPDILSEVTKQVQGGSVDEMLRLGLKALGIALGGTAISVCVLFLSTRIAAGVGKRLREKVFKKVQGFSLAEIDQFGTASLITRTTNDVTQVSNVLTFFMRMVIQSPIILIGGVIMSIRKGGELTLVIAGTLPFLVILVVFVVIFAVPQFRSMQKKVDKLTVAARERLTGVRVIRAFNNEPYSEERFDEANRDVTKTAIRVNKIMSIMMPAVSLLFSMTIIAIYWVGVLRADSVAYAADMAAVMQYAMRIMQSFMMLAMLFIMIPRASVSAGRIDAVLNTENSIPDEGTITQVKSGEVVFSDVCFRFGEGDNVLDRLNFTARTGEMTAIIGGTGSGKSTILNLIARFYKPASGQIFVGGDEISTISQRALRDSIGLVPQTAVLTFGTVLDNLRYGKEDATLEEAVAACKIAQADGFISAMPLGYESPVAQGGTNFSGGQKQRLSIARAVIKKPLVYLFDDSFSALDAKTDSNLRKALKAVTADATVIVVAQKVSTILSADKIIVLENGTIAGMGTHAELLETCPAYADIVKSQIREEENV